ncbi:DNA polymerase IV [Elioraea sp.]|uniref:DNA polymerase IV n=1 Tax=Elioraea sp. TaxID=2185103 RepID=UPI0025C42B40|nr:DNA polymerase IV [Elioraea sp.]
MPAMCRDCDAAVADEAQRCEACGSPRIVRHPELFSLAIAHLDCDAFYASVEKRDRPELADKPLIVGGGRRGVVTAACYVARTYGVRSAMPMFKALALCPHAVVIRPDMAKYVEAGRAVRSLMERLTPLVQPLSIDEAVLDLTGTEALHQAPPAVVLARLARDVEREVRVTVSIGLAPNRMLAKMAAERDKPRGFAVIGQADAASVLAPMPVSALPGVGPKAAARLAAKGFVTLGQIAILPPPAALRALGDDGPALAAMARGEDGRAVDPSREAKSISAETTFNDDLSALADLERALWPLAEKLSGRLKAKGLAAGGVTLKLKTSGFVSRTRHARLPEPTQMADTLFAAARGLLAREATGARFRLIGIGADPLADGRDADRGDLADPAAPKRKAMDQAMDRLREKFGSGVIGKGRGLR